MPNFFNKKCSEDGYLFDSLEERNLYRQLLLRQAAGEIRNLVVKTTYVLQPAFRHQKKYYAAITYTDDFSFDEVPTDRHVIMDYKEFITQQFALRMKMLLYQHPEWTFQLVGVKPKKKPAKLSKKMQKMIISDTGR